MKPQIVLAVVALLGTTCEACGIPAGTERMRAAHEAIQGGTPDTTHSFVVALVERENAGVALCSGSLLAPNLVATARHCVSNLSSTTIDCATSSFGAAVSASQLVVATGSVLDGSSAVYGIDSIVVPNGANQSKVCGNDIALLILSKSITLPQYVTPVISPPMTDHSAYSSTMTAIGYGVDSPTDTTGTSAGVRRIRQDVDIACIPNDPNFGACFGVPSVANILSPDEFVTDGAACEGDSGSGAFEQRSFNAGSWLSFGVLSRGGSSADAQACAPNIYTRFDQWSELLIDTARTAAGRGGYAIPAWAAQSPSAVGAAEDSVSADASCGASDEPCTGNGDCCSAHCVSHDNGITHQCFECSATSPCDVDASCVGGKCVFTSPSIADAGQPSPSANAGCALAPDVGRSGDLTALFATLGVAAMAARRRTFSYRRIFESEEL